MHTLVQQKFDSYPEKARETLLHIRTLIYEISVDLALGEVEESLKWGEPSYVVSKGSPIRIDYKPAYPEHVSLFFNCNSLLVETFRSLHGQHFEFIGNREWRLPLTEPIPVDELMQCLSMALRYHRIKHLALLGA